MYRGSKTNTVIMSLHYLVKYKTTYQRQTAGKYHGDNETLKVSVFDQFVHVTAASPPDATSNTGAYGVTAATVADTE